MGQSWDELPVSPVAELLLTNLDLNKPDEIQIMRHVLGPDALHAVLAVDPNGPVPALMVPAMQSAFTIGFQPRFNSPA